MDATSNVFVSANVRPSWEELAVDLIHGIGPGESGQQVVLLQEHKHFILFSVET